VLGVLRAIQAGTVHSKHDLLLRLERIERRLRREVGRARALGLEPVADGIRDLAGVVAGVMAGARNENIGAILDSTTRIAAAANAARCP
jgi:NaMN:DMB phosphoribosyltransferase